MFIVNKLSIREMMTENARQIEKKKQTFCARKNEQTLKSFKNRYASTF